MHTEFASLSEYLNLSKKIISKLAPKVYHHLATEMLNDEDAIADVANALMQADYKWSPAYRSKSNKVRSLRSYRNQRVIWAIKAYVTRKTKEKKNHNISLSYVDESNNHTALSGLVADASGYSPYAQLEMKETAQEAINLVNNILASDLLTEQQSRYLTGYYLEGKTFREIGAEHNVTKQAVQASIKNSLKTVRNAF